MKARTFNTSEEFKTVVESEFLPTLAAYSQGIQLGRNYTHPDICEVQVMENPMQREVYSVYRNAITKEAVWMKGQIPKQQVKNIN